MYPFNESFAPGLNLVIVLVMNTCGDPAIVGVKYTILLSYLLLSLTEETTTVKR
jgi:hypothetical protein